MDREAACAADLLPNLTSITTSTSSSSSLSASSTILLSSCGFDDSSVNLTGRWVCFVEGVRCVVVGCIRVFCKVY